MDNSVLDRFAAYDGPLGTVLDIGACHGVLSVAAAERGAERVFAIEAQIDNFNRLQEVAREHSAIIPVLAAVGPVSGGVAAVRVAAADNPGQAGTRFSERYPVSNFAATVGINDLLLCRPDYVKIDVEGDEWSIFRALDPEMLAGVSTIDVELHDLSHGLYYDSAASDVDVAGILEAAGFEVDGVAIGGGRFSGHVTARRSALRAAA